jgi:glycosyltransferase involved in cell wall biosynthesis
LSGFLLPDYVDRLLGNIHRQVASADDHGLADRCRPSTRYWNPRVRIALVHPYSWPEVRRGGERYLADLAWYLVGAGHHVAVITGTEGAGTVHVDGRLTERKLRHRTPRALASRGATHDETFGALALRHLVGRRYDAVHAFTPTAALAGRAAGLPTVYTVLGHPDPDVVRRRPGIARLFRQAVRRSTVTVALSRASAAATEESFGRQADVLPPGIRLDRFPPDLAARRGPPKILFSADAADRRKRVQDALGAVGVLLETRPDVRLQLSGAGRAGWALDDLGERRAAILAATDELGLGALDDVPARYRAATVTVLPSEGEAFGLALVESLASGTPAVCSDVGGPREIISSPAVGRVVRHGDTVALAAALGEAIDLAADEQTPARCVEHARQWGWIEAVGPQHEAVYDAIARRGGRRARTRR